MYPTMPNGKSEKLTRNFLLEEEALFVLWIVLFHGCNGTRSNGRIEHIPQRGRLIGRSQLKRATRSSNGAQIPPRSCKPGRGGGAIAGIKEQAGAAGRHMKAGRIFPTARRSHETNQTHTFPQCLHHQVSALGGVQIPHVP